MPDPNDYENQEAWMEACVPTRIDEGEEQDQAVAVCLNIWRERKSIRSGPGAYAPTCPECAGKVTPELWELTMENIVPQPCIYCATETKSLREYRDNPRLIKASNALKAISRTDTELRVGNYIVLFGGRDLEGVASDNKNADGTIGEYFTPQTQLESSYTKAGFFHVDWEHGIGELGNEVLGVVDWKTARIDDRGVFVERVLNRRSEYVKWVEELIDLGLVGTSSEAMPKGVQKADDGEILRWPLYRDTLTVTPMEPRMLTENTIQAFKALGIPVPDDTSKPEPETGATPEGAEASVVAVGKARARLIQFLNRRSSK